MVEIKMKYFHLWSGGKDSTASIILDHMHGLPPSKIIMSEVMFDKRRNISGELPEHMEWVKNKAIPLFKEWGYEVEILRAEKDYLDLFYHVVTKSKKPERNGKYNGWLIGGMCAANDRLKIQPIKNFYKGIKEEYIQYIGIAVDEPKRLEKLKGTNKVSLLEKFNFTEHEAYNLCKEYDLLSPIYKHFKRGGCWFCPNQTIKQYSYIKAHYPELWEELEKLSNEPNIISPQGFRRGKTFQQVKKEVNEILENKYWAAVQLTIFD